MKKPLLFTFFIVNAIAAYVAQNTVGLITYNPELAQDGYNIHFPHNQPHVYLLNNCGEIVNVWEGDADQRPGNTAYLTEDGNLIKTTRNASVSGDAIWAGGGGATVEIRTWENELLWSYTLNDTAARLHHDIAPMPNGNILMLAWEKKTMQEAVNAGRDPNNLPDGELWPEMILEIKPNLDDTIMNSYDLVWEWHVWDHMVQDLDSAKDNFGVVGDHPELIDINYDTHDGDADWLHANSIDYNTTYDQIMVSIPYFDELWIIDHSTTTQQAASHTGGLVNAGGDLIYRWGNLLTYDAGDSTDQKLFFQHDVHWVGSSFPTDPQDVGKLMVFNNRAGEDYSTVNTLIPSFDTYEWEYPMTDGRWGPPSFDWTYQTTPPSNMYSTGLSSAQRLENGNTLICVGRDGYTFEITDSEEVVWVYENPMNSGVIVSQGDTVPYGGNLNFRVKRYPADYVGFEGKDLSAQGFIENNPNEELCAELLSVKGVNVKEETVVLYPNPIHGAAVLVNSSVPIHNVQVYDLIGNQLRIDRNTQGKNQIEFALTNIPNGVYTVVVNGTFSSKLVVNR